MGLRGAYLLSGLCHVWYLLRLSRRLHGCFEIKFASRRLSRSDSDLADSGTAVFYESGARGQEIAAAGGKKEKPRRRTALYKKPRKTAAIYAKAQKASRTLLGSGAGAAVAWDCPLRASVRHGRVFWGGRAGLSLQTASTQAKWQELPCTSAFTNI